MSVVSKWNMVDNDSVMAKTVNGFKTKLERERAKKMGLFLDWCLLDLGDVTGFRSGHPASIHTQPFNSPFSRTTRVGRYQKGKTNLDITEARDSEWQWHQLGICKSAPRSRQITTPAPHHSVFYRPDALPVTQPTASKHWRQKHWRHPASIL